MLEILVTSSLLIAVLVLLRGVWRKTISRRLQYALWLLAALRLLLPVEMFENPFNIMNIIQPAAQGKELSGYGSKGTSLGTFHGTGKVVYNGNWTKEKGGSEQDVQTQARSGSTLAGSGNALESRERAGMENVLMGQVTEVTGITEEVRAAGGMLGLKTQERILEGGSGLEKFFTRGLWRYAWYAGMALLGLWMIGCNLVFRWKLSKNRTLLGREGGLMVYLAEGISSPCLLGVLHPAIYLTYDSAQNPRHKEYAVLHELTHYRHGDHIWALVRSICLVVYWFDPLVWLAVYLSSKDCEMACDEGMVRRLGEERSQEYGCTLIEMAASGNRGAGLLYCAAQFSIKKRELRDRIAQIAAGKKRTGLLVAVLVAVCGTLLAACTFGGGKKENEMGRYVETNVELPGTKREYYGLAQDGDVIRLIAAAGLDRMSVDGGETFAMVEAGDMPQGVLDIYNRNPARAAGSIKGARIFYQYEGFGDNMVPSTWLITETGEEIKLEVLGDHWVKFCYSRGYFWICDMAENGARLYRLDPVTSEMQCLAEGNFNAYYMAADEEKLYLVNSGGVQLFDLEEGTLCAEQDQVLSDFAAGKYTRADEVPVMLYPWQDGVYLLTHQGIYWHKLYEETVELVVDGGYCSIGNTEWEFAGLAVRETEGEPEFFVLCSQGELLRYTYDASLPAVPDVLRIYSVYEDSQVWKAVNAFRAQHPDIPVVYEVGMNAAYGAAVDDVLKNLATEIAAGNGPDILVMDDIPFDSYVEKGVLADLSFLRAEMTQETYFVNVVDAFVREGKLYAVPMTFAVPVLAGQEELLKGMESLEDLADLLEKERMISQADYVFCTWDAESTLRLLAQSSQGAWLRDGNLDREAVEEFLTQAKRIYDIQFSTAGVPEKYGSGRYIEEHDLIMPGLWIGDYKQYPLARRFCSDGLYCMFDKAKWTLEDASCYGGFMSGGERDWLLIQTMQKMHEDTYVKMPGQQYGTCLASSLLAVNAGTSRMEESLQFLKYAVSSEFLSNGALNGAPVSREAYLAKQGTLWKEIVEGDSYYSWFPVTTTSGKEIEYILYLPGTEDYEKLTELLDGVTGVNLCDTVVYETVVEYGAAALTGEMELSEAVEAIEKRVKIYLAE